jgi:uncharacterized protein (DUF697 family)
MSVFEMEYETEAEGPLGAEAEAELATELLEVQSEEELEQFLGNLVNSVAKGVGGFIKSPAGKALGGVLKNVAKKALPVVGGALGSFVAPGVGTAIGSQLGQAASGLFELELEGMDHQEAEFETARHFVRFASEAAQNAALANPDIPPWSLVSAAVADAAKTSAPGLLTGRRTRATTGRWVRRGNRIVVIGA